MSDKPKLLICDDELGIRESLKVFLENIYKLSFAKNSQEALNLIKTEDFDLLIIDVKMPGINGLDAVMKIKKVKPAQKIIMFTGYESISIVEEASRLGVISYLTKPVGKEKLLKTIEEALK